MREWLKQFTAAVEGAFGERVRFIGLQGSYGRGEATEESDIDMVVVLDELTYSDLRRYDEAVSALPRRENLCGFVSGERELKNWDRGDLFQFYHDTTPLYGNLDWIKPLIGEADILRAMRLGACNLYHMCVHNAIHEKSPEILRSLLKSAVFVLQAKHYLETGQYVKTRSELRRKLAGDDLEVLCSALERDPRREFEGLSEQLMNWSGGLIRG